MLTWGNRDHHQITATDDWATVFVQCSSVAIIELQFAEPQVLMWTKHYLDFGGSLIRSIDVNSGEPPRFPDPDAV